MNATIESCFNYLKLWVKINVNIWILYAIVYNSPYWLSMIDGFHLALSAGVIDVECMCEQLMMYYVNERSRIFNLYTLVLLIEH